MISTRAIAATAARAALCCAVAAVLALAAPTARAQLILESIPEIEGVGVVEKRGERVPMDIKLTDSFGNERTIDEFFDGERPVILILGYYDCPLLCTRIFSAAQESFNDLRWTIGEEFRVLTVSFDHDNTPAMAREQQVSFLAGYGREIDDEDWAFCLADASEARRLTNAVGYHYRYLPDQGEYSHPSTLIFLSPDGTVSTYLVNLIFPPRDVRLALMDAAEGKIGSIFDRIEHFCFIYDPNSGGYVFAMSVMRIGGLLTMLALGAFIAIVVWSNIRKRDRERTPSGSGAPAAA